MQRELVDQYRLQIEMLRKQKNQGGQYDAKNAEGQYINAELDNFNNGIVSPSFNLFLNRYQSDKITSC